MKRTILLILKSEYLLFAVAGWLAMVFYRHGSITGYGEGLYHLLYAQHLFMGHIPPYLYNRDPAHGLVVFLSGALHADSIYPLLLVQAIMSVLTMVFIYHALAPVSRRVALAAGWANVASFIPFQFQNMIFNDHVFAFFFSLLCYTTLRAWRANTPMRLYDLAVAIGWLSLTRLTLWIALPIPLLVLACGIRRLPARRWRHGLAILAVLGGFAGANYYFRYAQFGDGVAPVQSQIGWQALSNMYRFNQAVPGSFSPQDGPVTALLHERMAQMLEAAPGLARQYHLNGKTVDEQVASMFRQPHYGTFRLIYTEFVMSDPSRRLDVELMWEQLRTHPLLLIPIAREAFLDNAFAYYRTSIGAPNPMERHYHGFPAGYKIVFMPLYYLPETNVVAKGMGGNIEQELRRSMERFETPEPYALPWHVYYDAWFTFCVSAASVLALLGVLAALWLLRRRGAWREADLQTFILLHMLYWPPAMLISGLVYMTYRYHVETACWLIALGCLGARLIGRAARGKP